MKIETRQVQGFLKNPDPRARAVLLYGPDGGMVRERARHLTQLVAEDPEDPFRVVELSGAVLKDDPARLADEAAALCFTGGRRVIRVRDPGEGSAKLFEAFLADPPGEALVVIEAGDLSPRSGLRKAFEKSPSGAALACYRDEGRDLEALLRGTLKKAGLEAAHDAFGFLLRSLGGDRQVTRRELEKLILFKGDDKTPLTLAEVEASIGDSSALAAEDIAFAVGGGDLARLSADLPRFFAQGGQPVAILRTVSGHFMRLHLVSGLRAEGLALGDALKRLRPPLFWKRKDLFGAQLQRWSRPALEQALGRLLETERRAKTTGAPVETLTYEVLYSLAQSAHPATSRYNN